MLAPSAKSRQSVSLDELRRLITLVAPYRGKVLLSFAAMTFTCLGLLGLPLFCREMLGGAIHLRQMTVSHGFALAIVAGFLLLGASAYASSILLFQVAHDLTARLRGDYVRQLLLAPVGYHRNSSIGQLMERLSGSLADIDWFIKRGFGSLLGVVILMAGGVVMLLFLNWKLALFSGCAAPVMALGMRVLNDRSRRLQGRRMNALEALIASLHGLLTGIEVVKAFSAEAREQRRFEARQEQLLDVQRIESRVAALMEPLLITMAALTFIVVLFYGSQLIARGDLAPEELITFLIYLAVVIPNARNLAQQIAQWRHLNVALDRLEETAAIVPERDESGAAPLSQPVRGEVEFIQVRYGYQEREQVLRDLSFRLGAGERVGIVGESGAGKSTLFNLLLRFYAPGEGRILVDGQELQAITLRSLREAIAMVPQDNILFDDTILENVRYGNPDASDAEVRTACEAARAAAFIGSLPSGYLTRVGERGLRLSGGQRQRLAIARAFLKNSPILLMDEATSSLDAGTENELRVVMEELMKNRTTLVIAHRLSTVTHLPRILMVSEGRILDDGSPEELFDRCPAYRTFVSTQLIRQ
ncbi:MAG: ABC transporter ATP-binding protein [Verrucomicrobiota bacterium]